MSDIEYSVITSDIIKSFDCIQIINMRISNSCECIMLIHLSRDMRFPTLWYARPAKIVSEYDQEIPQSQTADNPMGRPVITR